MCSVAERRGPAIQGSSLGGFHCVIATKPFCSETSKAARGQIGDHSSIRDFSPIAVSGYPRGPSLVNSSEARIVTQKAHLVTQERIASRCPPPCRFAPPLF